MATIQLIEGLAGIILGLALGGCYDCYRVLFPCGKAGSLLRALGDLLWWLFAFCLTFVVLILLNWGELRVYFFLFLAFGFWCWHILLSRLFRRLLSCLLVLGKRVLGFAYRLLERSLILLCSPIFLFLQLLWKLLSLLRKPCGWLFGKGKQTGRFYGGKIKQTSWFQKLYAFCHKRPPEE